MPKSWVETWYYDKLLRSDQLYAIVVVKSKYNALINEPTGMKPMPYEKIDLFAANDWTMAVYARDPDLDVVDLTGATAILTWRYGKDGAIVLQKSTAVVGEGQIGAADEGEMLFYIKPEDTESLDIRQYPFDVRIELSNGKKYTGITGYVNLKDPVNDA